MGTAAIKACICSGGGGEKEEEEVEEEEAAGGGTAGIDFNNPHLTGGETTKQITSKGRVLQYQHHA